MNTGILVSVGVPIALGLLTLIGGYLVAKALKPSDIMQDNDRLRDRIEKLEGSMDEQRGKLDDLSNKYTRERNILGDGFDALYRQVQRLMDSWGTNTMPTMTKNDQAAVDAAKNLREQ